MRWRTSSPRTRPWLREAVVVSRKETNEFHRVAMDDATWHVPAGYPDGNEQKILTGTLDEVGKSGNRTRLLRFRPGAFTTQPFVHDYWEEVYLISGDLII